MSTPPGNIPANCKTLVQEVRKPDQLGPDYLKPCLQEKEIVLKETPVPAVGKNEVLIKVRAIGLNPIDVTSASNLLFI